MIYYEEGAWVLQDCIEEDKTCRETEVSPNVWICNIESLKGLKNKFELVAVF